MKGYADERSVPQGELEPESAGNKCAPNSAVGFPPRRSRFFSFTGTRKEFVSAEQEYALTKLIKESDPVIRQQTTVRYLRTVVDVAKRYTDLGLEFVDLVHEGNQGLIHALEHFEPEAGLCFSAFVDRCICQSIECAIISRSSNLDHRIAFPDSSISGRSMGNDLVQTSPIS